MLFELLIVETKSQRVHKILHFQFSHKNGVAFHAYSESPPIEYVNI